MREVPVTMSAWSTPKLDGELRAALNSKYDSLSTYGTGRPIIVRLVDGTTPSDDATVQAVCLAHDPTPLPDPIQVAVDTAKSQAGTTPIDGLTVAQAVTYINTNIVDLPTAKAGLVVLVKYIGVQEARIRRLEKLAGL